MSSAPLTYQWNSDSRKQRRVCQDTVTQFVEYVKNKKNYLDCVGCGKIRDARDRVPTRIRHFCIRTEYSLKIIRLPASLTELLQYVMSEGLTLLFGQSESSVGAKQVFKIHHTKYNIFTL
jgi:hypothetical protein